MSARKVMSWEGVINIAGVWKPDKDPRKDYSNGLDPTRYSCDEILLPLALSPATGLRNPSDPTEDNHINVEITNNNSVGRHPSHEAGHTIPALHLRHMP